VPASVSLRVIGYAMAEIRMLLRELLGEEFPVEAFCERANEHYQRLIGKKPFPIKPCLIELLDFLEGAGLKKAVATSSASATAKKKLAAGEVRERFQAVVSSQEVARGKPAPDVYLESARRLGTGPSKCIVLEDSELGIRGAHAAGMHAVMVPDLIAPSEDIRRLTTAIFPSLCEFLEYLKGR
jgi:HAD superfamily hydrolase (TIGR01509 family)